MFSRPVCVTALMVFLGLASWASATTPEGLKVYGSSGPSPAINDAATAFGARHQVTVEVHSGPVDSWIDRAGADADLVFASAGFMMTRFERTESLHVVPTSVTPLYMRPSVVLVRPDNPHGIRDFPDLLQPGLKVMIVSGSGQTGMWEDMIGRFADIRAVRDLRANIAYYAETSDDAMKVWKQNKEIDAWITWNIWYMPLRDSAKLIPVSADYRMYRHCSIALTERGSQKPLAREFAHFLTSPEGEEIFTSWGWTSPQEADAPLAVKRDICAVCQIDGATERAGGPDGLQKIRAMLDEYQAIGVPLAEVHLTAVFQGDAVRRLLTDEAYARVNGEGGSNPDSAAVRELLDKGVQIEICGRSLEEKSWAKTDLIPGVKIIASAYPRIIDLQGQGYAYVGF